jgi:hypothetical protein
VVAFLLFLLPKLSVVAEQRQQIVPRATRGPPHLGAAAFPSARRRRRLTLRPGGASGTCRHGSRAYSIRKSEQFRKVSV